MARVLLSYSGAKSRGAAKALDFLLSKALPSVEITGLSADIALGNLWRSQSIEEGSIAIILFTDENIRNSASRVVEVSSEQAFERIGVAIRQNLSELEKNLA